MDKPLINVVSGTAEEGPLRDRGGGERRRGGAEPGVCVHAEPARRLVPAFSPRYRQASWPQNAFLDQVIVRLRPAFRYPSQINANLKAGNYRAIAARDRQYCQELVSPLPLITFDDWLREHLGLEGAGV